MAHNKIANTVMVPNKVRTEIIKLLQTYTGESSGLTDSGEAVAGKFYIVSSLASVLNITMPDPAASPNQEIAFKLQLDNLGGNTVVLSASAGTIEGQTTYTLNVPRMALRLRSDGTSEWMIV